MCQFTSLLTEHFDFFIIYFFFKGLSRICVHVPSRAVWKQVLLIKVLALVTKT